MKNKIRASILVFGLACLSGTGSVLATVSVLNSSTDLLTVKGYTDTGTAGALQVANGTTTTGCYNNQTTGCTPQLVFFGGGYGVTSNAADALEPNHALDNNGNKESLLLNFGASTQLNNVKLGYTNTDADITVLAWKPQDYMNSAISSVTAPSIVSGTTKYADLIGLGWKLVGNYSNLGTLEDRAVNVSSPVSSSYWLVMAYNSAFSGQVALDASARGFAADTTPDYGKFYSVSYSTGTKTATNSVSEPSTALLFGVAMFGFVGWRNRKNSH